MLEAFIESCQEAVHDFEQALRTHDAGLLRATAHKLKPSLDHLHMHQLLPLVRQLDQWPGTFDAALLVPLIGEVVGLLRQVSARMALDLAALAPSQEG